ncbi:MAG TPA: SDR family NAD(P)-dependent oxidoreductase, partial [Stellaceae bacterium]|nr:SDR family NAD(P)-dependent oxidoreductase [Stellaceae bacterium]
MADLNGRVALVTGASSGIGRAVALRLAQDGAEIFAVAEGPEAALRDAAARCGGRSTWRAIDLAEPGAAERMVAECLATLGRVDILVNNAGVGTAVPASRETPEQFRSVLEINLEGCYWMAQAAARVMPAGSSIINVSSVLGIVTAGLPQAAYAASKAGLLGLTRDLAAQWTSRKGIRVNAVAPGFFASEMTDAY